MAGKTTNKPTMANQQSGGANDFTIITSFKNGYRNREDITVLPPGVLVEGSENVLTNTHQRVGIRKGYTLDGQANSSLAPIGGTNGAMGTFDWRINGGGERNMRSGFLTSAGNDGKLQYRYVADDGTVTWRDLLTNLTSTDFNYTVWWDIYQHLQVMLAVNGESDIVYWGGGVTTLASASADTGIINAVDQTPNSTGPVLSSGGVGYVVGDQITITGGSGTAKLTVYTTVAGAVNTTAIHTAGSGYAPGDNIVVDGAGIVPYCQMTVLTVGGGGAVATYSIYHNGSGYTAATNVSTGTNGAGSGFTIDILSVGLGVDTWGFATSADRGSGYSVGNLIATTGGSGTNAKVSIESVMSGSLTKSGTETWAEAGFTFATVGTVDSHQVTINGHTYTYANSNTGDTTTLYGVTPDPSGEAAGSVVNQTAVVYPNSLGTIFVQNELPFDFKNQLIGVLEQRLFIGSLTSSWIFISEVNSFLRGSWDYAPTTSVGEALLVTTTSPPTAIIPQEEFMYISAGRDEWYNVSFTIGTDLTNLTATETATVNRLNTTAQQASQSQAVTNKIANSVVFLSFEPYLNTFGRVDNIYLTPQMTDIAYSIVNLMNSYDFTNASVFYYRKFVYVAVPREGVVLVYNMTDVNNPYWEAPQRMPIARFSIIGGDLYGHSSQVSESYKLFDGTNDNGFPIAASATFSFNNYGTRTTSKGYNEFYVEGYISSNTTLQVGIQFDIDGCARQTFKEIIGSDTQIVCLASDSASLGKVPLGKNPLGGVLVPATTTPKFRVIKTFPLNYFYEDQISFSSTGIDQQWEVIAFGPQLVAFSDLNNKITQ